MHPHKSQSTFSEAPQREWFFQPVNTQTGSTSPAPFKKSGLLIFRGKKSKISRDFQGQIRGKIDRFRGIFAGKKSKFAAQSADFGRFSRERSQNSRKIGPFRGILVEKSQFSKDFQGQILRKIGRFHGKFRGGNFAKKQSVKISRFRWIFFGKFR